jgi:polysaccharide biosynthesis transport protein
MSKLRQLPDAPGGAEFSIPVSEELQRESTGEDYLAPAGLNIARYAEMFWRRGGLLLCVALAGAFVALFIAILQTPYYQAQSSLELEGVNDMYLGIRDVTPEDNNSLTETYMQTQAMVLGGEDLVRRTLETNHRQVQDAPASLMRFSIIELGEALRRKHPPSVTPDTSGAERVMQHLTVRAVPLTRVIQLTYDDTDPVAAANFTNALVAEYIDTSIERRWDATRKTEQWLSTYLAPLKENLELSGRQLESFAQDSGLTGTSDNDTPAQAKLRDLQAELTKTHAERISKQALYETVANGPRERISPSINPSPLREYQTKLSDLRSERAQAVATLTPAHYKVQRLEAQIREMEHLIDQEWTKTLELIRSDYLALLRREALLTDSVQAQVALVAEQAGKRVHYDVLRRDLETNQLVYNNIFQKAKESAVLTVTKPSNIHVINEARPPARPFKPSLSLHAALGSLTGFFLGLVWVAYCERRQSELIAPGVVHGVGNFRELGVIPSVALGRYASFGLSAASKRGRARLIAAPASSFLFSESFQAAVASIMRSQCNGSRPSILTISSAMAGDGKTTVVTNLALALASIRHRVVVIEGDLRHPQLSKNFDVANSWGLSDILQSTNRLEEIPFEVLVRSTDKPGLYIVPSGPSSANVSSLLHSPRMGALLAALKNHADLILIDSPPLLAVSDARILASCSDAVILVVRAHKTGRETFRIAAQQLRDDQTPILGTILNAWDPRRARGMRDPFQYQYFYGK